MKKLMMMFLTVFGLIFAVGFKANAEDITTTDQENTTENTDLPGAGVKPGSFFYNFDKFFENVALKLTFSDEKRAERLSRYAEERLAELNELDNEKAQKYADELFNEYGLDVEKAHIYLQNLVAEGKLSEDKLAKLETRIEKAEMKQERVQQRIQDHVSEEVRNEVQNAIKNAKMSIFNRFTDVEAMKQLHEEGYGYGELLKLQAISDLSGTSINDLLLIDGAVTTNDDNTKTINIQTILDAKNITIDELHDKVKEYKDAAKEQMKTKLKEAKNNASARRDEIKERAKNKDNENGKNH